MPPEEWFPAHRADLTARFIDTRSGVRLRVVEAGPASGEPVLLLHGWFASVYGYRHAFAPLAAAGYRVVAPDLKGHGLSDKPTERGAYTLEAMAAPIVDLMNRLGLGRVALVGHSMGGAIALHITRQMPERVRALVLLAPVGFGTVNNLALALSIPPAAAAPVLPYLVPRWLAAVVLRLTYGRRGRPSRRDVDEYWAPTQFPAFLRAMNALLHESRWGMATDAELAATRAPTLVIVGTHDRVITFGDVARLVRVMPSARLVSVTGAGHVLPEEAPDEVNAAMLDFLREANTV